MEERNTLRAMVGVKEQNKLVEVHNAFGHVLAGEVSVHLDEDAPLFE